MSAQRKELLVFGYMRHYCSSIGVELPTNHIIYLFVTWLSILDRWDKSKSHDDIVFDSDTTARCKFHMDYATCVGQYIIKKGMKQSWTMKSGSSTVLVGIIDNEMLDDDINIEDFTSTKYKGYGISLNGWDKYHDTDFLEGAEKLKYAQQFDIKDEIFLSMELDLTQKKSDDGILKFELHHEPNKDIDKIETDGECTNIAYNSIDINKAYRLAVDISGVSKGVELLEDGSLSSRNC